MVLEGIDRNSNYKEVLVEAVSIYGKKILLAALNGFFWEQKKENFTFDELNREFVKLLGAYIESERILKDPEDRMYRVVNSINEMYIEYSNELENAVSPIGSNRFYFVEPKYTSDYPEKNERLEGILVEALARALMYKAAHMAVYNMFAYMHPSTARSADKDFAKDIADALGIPDYSFELSLLTIIAGSFPYSLQDAIFDHNRIEGTPLDPVLLSNIEYVAMRFGYNYLLGGKASEPEIKELKDSYETRAKQVFSRKHNSEAGLKEDLNTRVLDDAKVLIFATLNTLIEDPTGQEYKYDPLEALTKLTVSLLIRHFAYPGAVVDDIVIGASFYINIMSDIIGTPYDEELKRFITDDRTMGPPKGLELDKEFIKRNW